MVNKYADVSSNEAEDPAIDQGASKPPTQDRMHRKISEPCLTNSSSATEAGDARADYEESPMASLCSLERVVRRGCVIYCG
jgi:hypothetical protein